jgi:hypothetical protein
MPPVPEGLPTLALAPALPLSCPTTQSMYLFARALYVRVCACVCVCAYACVRMSSVKESKRETETETETERERERESLLGTILNNVNVCVPVFVAPCSHMHAVPGTLDARSTPITSAPKSERAALRETHDAPPHPLEARGHDVLCDFPSFYKPHKHQRTIVGR